MKTGEPMGNNHILHAIAQNMPPWLGVALGHFSQNVTLSNIALLTSIAYSVVNIWVHLRKVRGSKS
jgi:hypothetical protein